MINKLDSQSIDNQFTPLQYYFDVAGPCLGRWYQSLYGPWLVTAGDTSMGTLSSMRHRLRLNMADVTSFHNTRVLHALLLPCTFACRFQHDPSPSAIDSHYTLTLTTIPTGLSVHCEYRETANSSVLLCCYLGLWNDNRKKSIFCNQWSFFQKDPPEKRLEHAFCGLSALVELVVMPHLVLCREELVTITSVSAITLAERVPAKLWYVTSWLYASNGS